MEFFLFLVCIMGIASFVALLLILASVEECVNEIRKIRENLEDPN